MTRRARRSATSGWTASRRPRCSTSPSRRGPRSTPPPTSPGGRSTGLVEASRIARVWISPERARWSREQRRVAQDLADGSVIVELPYKGTDWLVREVLAEAGDAAVLSPPEAREAVRAAVDRLQLAVR